MCSSFFLLEWNIIEFFFSFCFYVPWCSKIEITLFFSISRDFIQKFDLLNSLFNLKYLWILLFQLSIGRFSTNSLCQMKLLSNFIFIFKLINFSPNRIVSSFIKESESRTKIIIIQRLQVVMKWIYLWNRWWKHKFHSDTRSTTICT